LNIAKRIIEFLPEFCPEELGKLYKFEESLITSTESRKTRES